MNRLFNPDAPVMQFLSRIADLVILNLVWLALCVPVVTIGAATTALYRVLLNMAAGTDGALMKDFFRAFRSNFKPATLTWLILLVPSALCAVNLWLLLGGALGASALMVLVCVLPLALLVFVFAYVFAYIATFENTIWQTLRNVLLLSIANLPRTLLMSILNLLPVILFLLTPATFLRLSIVWILIGFSLTAYLDAQILWRIFKKISPELAEGASAGADGAAED